MKIIILAAGIGSRLGNPFPKPLTPLKNGKSIMEMQTENIASRYDIDDINVVVGFKKDLIMERFPELTYVYNPFFDRTNTSKSLLQALKKHKDKSVLWFNGDVIFYKKFKKPRFGHKKIQQNAARLIGFNKYYNFKHTPHPLRKSTFESYFKANESVFIDNIKYRFRDKSQFTPQGLANHIEIKNKTCHLKNDLQLMYFRSYKKPLLWYKLKLNMKAKGKLFLGLQSLDRAPSHILEYILNWLEKRMA